MLLGNTQEERYERDKLIDFAMGTFCPVQFDLIEEQTCSLPSSIFHDSSSSVARCGEAANAVVSVAVVELGKNSLQWISVVSKRLRGPVMASRSPLESTSREVCMRSTISCTRPGSLNLNEIDCIGKSSHRRQHGVGASWWCNPDKLWILSPFLSNDEVEVQSWKLDACILQMLRSPYGNQSTPFYQIKSALARYSNPLSFPLLSAILLYQTNLLRKLISTVSQ